MKQIIQALVLNIVRHTDRTNIASIYTKQFGRISVAIPAAAPSQNRSRRNPTLMPLSIIEGEISTRAGNEVANLRHFALLDPLQRLRIDPAKTAVGMFVAEFLGHLLREQTADAAIWQIVTDALNILNNETHPLRIANFHLVLLWHMLTPTGIIPDLDGYNHTTSQWLDMRKGAYTPIHPTHSDFLAPAYAHLPPLIARINFRNSHLFRLSGQQRYQLCEVFLHYYAVHLPGLNSIRSHHILRTIFS